MPRTINDIFSGPAPAPAPVPSGSNPLSTLALVALVVVFGVLAFNRFSPGPAPRPDDNKEQEDQGDKKSDPVSIDLKDHMLVVIRDKKTLNDDVEYTVTMQDDEFWGWANSNLADVETLEDDDELAVKLLGKLKDKPPLVALVNVKSKDVVWSMPLPKGGTDSIRSKLK